MVLDVGGGTGPDVSDASAALPSSLEGVTVADFSRVLAGPLATMLLADLGADVIKIERADGGDDTRAWGPPWAPDGESSYFLGVNRNKRSVTLELTDPADLAVARRLAGRADVVIENFRPGVMARFGLDEPTLRAEHPALIYCRILGIGRGDVAGYDFLAQAVGRPDERHRRTRPSAAEGRRRARGRDGRASTRRSASSRRSGTVNGPARGSWSRWTCSRRPCSRWRTRPPAT